MPLIFFWRLRYLWILLRAQRHLGDYLLYLQFVAQLPHLAVRRRGML